MSEKTYTNRRRLLRATGGLVGFTSIVGTASAVCYEVEATAPYADVYDECNGEAIGYVAEGATGVTCNKCYDENDETWWHCEWDDADPDGWVHDSQVYVGW